MINLNRAALLAAMMAAGVAGQTSSLAAEPLTVAVSLRGGWSTAVTELGMTQEFFAKRGVEVELLYTQGSGESLQSVVSGSVDVSIALGASQVLGAFARGAPIRVIGGAFTGANDILWYVPADSPIQSMQDISGETIGFTSNGSSTHLALLSAIEQYGIDAEPTQTGGYTATLTQVMSGQVDAGWMAPPIGLKEEEEGQIRIIGSGADLGKYKDATVRVIVANANSLADKGDTIAAFIQGYRDTLDWLYTGTAGVEKFAEVMEHPYNLALRTRDDFFPKERMSPDTLGGWDVLMKDAVDFEFIDEPLTDEQLDELVQVPDPIE